MQSIFHCCEYFCFVASASDPLRLKPNPSNLVSKVVDSESSEDEGSSEPKLYMPPKVVSAPYEENPPIKQKSKILKQRTDLIDELREEVLDMPSEVKVNEFLVYMYCTYI